MACLITMGLALKRFDTNVIIAILSADRDPVVKTVW